MANFQRQLDILSPDLLIYPVTIIGLGGIGSRVAYDLRKMGFSNFVLWDPDIVEDHNLPSQHFNPSDLDNPKVEAIKSQIESSLDSKCLVKTFQYKFDPNYPVEGIVIAAVDNMAARKHIWEAVKKRSGFVPIFIDGRIGIDWDGEQGKVAGEWIEVFTINPLEISDCDLYENKSHMFTDEEAEPLRCTAQAVAYVGSIISGRDSHGSNKRNGQEGELSTRPDRRRSRQRSWAEEGSQVQAFPRRQGGRRRNRGFRGLDGDGHAQDQEWVTAMSLCGGAECSPLFLFYYLPACFKAMRMVLRMIPRSRMGERFLM